MLVGLRVLGSAFRQVLTHITASVLSNLVGTALSTPIIVLIGAAAYGTHSLSLIPLGVALLIGILPNPCAAGVHAVTQEFATSGYSTLSEHWTGFRHYFYPALRMWLLSVTVTALILANIVFYVRELGGGSGLLRSIAPGLSLAWGLVLIVWLSIHLHVFPLLMVQEVKGPWHVYRNAALMTLARPGVSLSIVPIWIFLLLLCATTGLATFIGLSICSAIQHTATSRLLPTFRLREAS